MIKKDKKRISLGKIIAKAEVYIKNVLYLQI